MTDGTHKEFEGLVALEAQAAQLSVDLRQLADDCGMSRYRIAQRMGIRVKILNRLLDDGMAYLAPMDRIARFVWACGSTLEIVIKKPKDPA